MAACDIAMGDYGDATVAAPHISLEAPGPMFPRRGAL